MVHCVQQVHELAPHRVRTLKLRRDERFADKLVDLVGLYLRSLENAFVLSVDEKRQIQALDHWRMFSFSVRIARRVPPRRTYQLSARVLFSLAARSPL